MRLIGYVRVSTGEQASEGVSLAAMRDKLEGYCLAHAIDLVGIEADEGLSGKSLDRPGLAAALDLLATDRADGLLVPKLDRLTRSLTDLDQLIRRYFSRDGARLISVAESIDTATATGRLMVFLIGLFAQWEREQIQERTQEALDHLRRKGERVGQIPYGKALAGDGRTLIDAPAELAALGRIAELAGRGQSLRAIAAALTAENHPTKSGRPWNASTVAALIKRSRTPA